MYLEERQAWAPPTDEQVERVLRKILAEKFSGAGMQPVENPNTMRDGDYFVENRKDLAILRPVSFDPAALLVEPEAVPSKAYAETIQMLESQLTQFPRMGMNRSPHEEGARDMKMNIDVKKPIFSESV